jgi:hypothetical protein
MKNKSGKCFEVQLSNRTGSFGVKMIKFLGCLFIFFSMACFSALAQESSANEGREATSGIAITGGYGYEYAGFGVAAEWYQHFESLNFGLMLGVGYFPSLTFGTVTTDAAVGFGVGARLAVGGEHRFIADLQYGFAGEAARVVGGSRETAAMWGATLAVGYQNVGRSGFLFQATVGGTWLVGALQWVTDLMGNPLPTINLGIGYKFF